MNNKKKENGFLESIIWQIYIHIYSFDLFLVRVCYPEHMTRDTGYGLRFLFDIDGEDPYFFLHCTFSEGFTLHQRHANAAPAAAEHVKEHTT